MRTISLSNSKLKVIVDDDDFEMLSLFTWWLGNHGYAVSKVCIFGAYIPITLHRLVANTPSGKETDHKNHNILDNRKSNIRSCSRSQNNMNRCKKKGTTSIYTGVWWDKKNKKWACAIKHSTKRLFLGRFQNEVDAARAYNKAASGWYGGFARLNIIKGETV